VRTTETAVRGADGQAGAGDEAAKETGACRRTRDPRPGGAAHADERETPHSRPGWAAAEMTFEQARRLQVFRSQLMSWHLLPSFYDTLVDCFVRYGHSIEFAERDGRVC